MSRLPLDGIYVCYHDDTDACECESANLGFLWPLHGSIAFPWQATYTIGGAAPCGLIVPSTPVDAKAATLAEADSWILQANRKD